MLPDLSDQLWINTALLLLLLSVYLLITPGDNHLLYCPRCGTFESVLIAKVNSHRSTFYIKRSVSLDRSISTQSSRHVLSRFGACRGEEFLNLAESPEELTWVAFRSSFSHAGRLLGAFVCVCLLRAPRDANCASSNGRTIYGYHRKFSTFGI